MPETEPKGQASLIGHNDMRRSTPRQTRRQQLRATEVFVWLMTACVKRFAITCVNGLQTPAAETLAPADCTPAHVNVTFVFDRAIEVSYLQKRN